MVTSLTLQKNGDRLLQTASVTVTDYLFLITAWAAAKRAAGTRYGEQET